MTLKPSIDYKKCKSCGTCTIIAPKIFGSRKDGVTVIKKYDNSMNGDYLRAKKACPFSAIL